MRDWRVDEAGGSGFLPVLHAGGRRQGRHLRHGPQRQRRGQTRDRAAGRRRLPAAPPQSRQHAHHGDRHRGRRSGDRRDRRDRASARAAEVLAARAGDAPRHRPPRAGRRRRRCGSVDYFAPKPVPLARLTGEGRSAPRRSAFDPAPLRAGRMPEPDLEDARRGCPSSSPPPRRRRRSREAAADRRCSSARSAAPPAPSGRSTSRSGRPATTAASRRRSPCSSAARAMSSSLQNVTPHQHPIHIHGHSFKWLKSNKRDLPVHHADTVLLQPREKVEVGASSPTIPATGCSTATSSSTRRRA